MMSSRPFSSGTFVLLLFLLVGAFLLSFSVGHAAGGPILITAVFYDGYQLNDDDEGIQIMNISASSVDLSGWQFTNNVGTVTFPAGTTLTVGGRLWLARKATLFKTTFGFLPNWEYAADTDPTVPNMTGTAPSLSNTGGEVVIKDNIGTVKDALVYEAGNTAQTGWSGAAVNPYGVFPMNDPEQVFYRKLDEATGYPIVDTDTEKDWAVSTTCTASLYGPVRDCDVYGKKPMAPGWVTGIIRPSQLPTDNWVTFKSTETANYSILAGPDNIYDNYIAVINAATTSIYIQGYTIHNPSIIGAIQAKAAAGVQVKMLLEGEPCCVSAPDQQSVWAAKQIDDAAVGTQVWFMSNAAPHHDRYNNTHAKFTIVDNHWLLTGTENLDCTSMAPDNKANGTSGNRGYYVKTDAPQIVNKYLAIFNLDSDPGNDDIVAYGTAPYTWDGTTVPAACSDGTFYTVQKPNPLNLSGTFNFEVVQAPDNALKYSESLIGMVRRAGAGDTVLVEQAYERKYWGTSSSSSPTQDPNPRLEAYIEAARRGAHVRILLDALYDDPNSPTQNTNTVAYVNSFAGPGVDISARLVDVTGGSGPAGSGIHAKIVMVYKPSLNDAWVHIGSINGSENSSKFNRETALQTESVNAYCYIYDLYNYDWQYSGGANLNLGCAAGPTATPTSTPTNTPTRTPTPTSAATNTPTSTPTSTAINSPTNTPTSTATNAPTNTPTSTSTNIPVNTATATATRTNTPLLTNTPTSTPTTLNHIVISEFRTRGPNGASDEFIELYNPTGAAVDLGGWLIKGSNNAGSVSTRVTIAAGTTLQPGSHFLATNVNGYSGSVVGNQTYSTGITDSGGIALFKSDGVTIVDQVGMSTGSAYKEGTPLSPLTGNT
ncbi:MAG TPA: lamin tail domain-containing protein, partial [Anaerolineae bacterium]